MAMDDGVSESVNALTRYLGYRIVSLVVSWPSLPLQIIYVKNEHSKLEKKVFNKLVRESTYTDTNFNYIIYTKSKEMLKRCSSGF